MLLTEKLDTYPFSETERIVVNYLLTEKQLIEHKTIKEIADITYTSPSIMIRIAKKLGFAGWNDLKKDYIEEVNYLEKNFINVDANFPFKQHDSHLEIANKLGILHQETIMDTLSLLKAQQIQSVINLINNADDIVIFSNNINIQLVQDFVHKMKRIKRRVSVSELDGEQLFEAANLDNKTLAIIISYSGETKRILELVPFLKHSGVPILALTSIGDNSLVKETDNVLYISTREKLYSKIGSFSSHTSICFLLDIIYSCIFSIDYKDNLDNLIYLSKMNDPRSSKSKILKE
ncbi:MurR/RpiR family transcriptional regulator [Vagococcus coleopterorum]|uniref:MurR/RpiR family transcriptional regulator n=1 Tax=Vagococcus coleopterorum TaxID=2714946 RepID=A0A6G8AP40_9ENTE|nr:MurR/RpiR family transcriptional regulator [Vagococcus coleopterorum]QIL46841.1 MurR/RpiR family transcriptional regulator [Vagococcus coleopterorum]